MKKSNFRIKTEIVSISNDLNQLFEALKIAVGEKAILDLWKAACKKEKSKIK